MSDANADVYALAGAISVGTADLLRNCHRAAGYPLGPDAKALPVNKRALAVAASQTLGAAGTCSVVTGRLLVDLWATARVRLLEVPPPQVTEYGVTVLEGLEHATWAATVRAVAAAGAEVAASLNAWSQWNGPAATDVQASLRQLLDYMDQLAALLETSEPGREPPANTLRHGSGSAATLPGVPKLAPPSSPPPTPPPTPPSSAPTTPAAPSSPAPPASSPATPSTPSGDGYFTKSPAPKPPAAP